MTKIGPKICLKVFMWQFDATIVNIYSPHLGGGLNHLKTNFSGVINCKYRFSSGFQVAFNGPAVIYSII